MTVPRPVLARRAALSLAAFGAVAPRGFAQAPAQLTVGLSFGPTAMDPHFYIAGRNTQVSRHIFDGLTNQDDRQRIVPAVAVSWRATAPLVWEFRLRPGLRFHDGTPVTARDVEASIARVPAIRNSPSSFTPYVTDIAGVEAVGADLVRITTRQPMPLLPANLSKVAIIPAASAALSTEELNAGRGLVGTGAFRFREWRINEYVLLEKNPDWWGGPVAWDRVQLRTIPEAGARVAALLSGAVDLIQDVPPQSHDVVRSSGRSDLVSTGGNRLFLFQIDSDRAQSPQVTGTDGQPLSSNPLRDARVRRALSLAIDRQAIVARLMNGSGVPSGQLVPEGYPGHLPGLRPPAQDLTAARRLLAEAGYPDGFGLTIHGPNGLYPNDAQTLQAIGQMFTRAGIRTRVEALSPNIFQPRAARLEFSVTVQGAAVETGEPSSMIRPVMATYDRERGYGTGNRGRYSNPRLDELLGQALVELDDTRRLQLLQDATTLAMEEVAVLPVFFFNNDWGVRQGVEFLPRTDGFTLAEGARPKAP